MSAPDLKNYRFFVKDDTINIDRVYYRVKSRNNWMFRVYETEKEAQEYWPGCKVEAFTLLCTTHTVDQNKEETPEYKDQEETLKF